MRTDSTTYPIAVLIEMATTRRDRLLNQYSAHLRRELGIDQQQAWLALSL